MDSPSAALLDADMDDLGDDDDDEDDPGALFDDAVTNEDELDEEWAAQTGIPVESLAQLFGRGELNSQKSRVFLIILTWIRVQRRNCSIPLEHSPLEKMSSGMKLS